MKPLIWFPVAFPNSLPPMSLELSSPWLCTHRQCNHGECDERQSSMARHRSDGCLPLLFEPTWGRIHFGGCARDSSCGTSRPGKELMEKTYVLILFYSVFLGIFNIYSDHSHYSEYIGIFRFDLGYPGTANLVVPRLLQNRVNHKITMAPNGAPEARETA